MAEEAEGARQQLAKKADDEAAAGVDKQCDVHGRSCGRAPIAPALTDAQLNRLIRSPISFIKTHIAIAITSITAPETPEDERAARMAELAALGYGEEYTQGIDAMPTFLMRQPTPDEMAQVAEMQRMVEEDKVVIPRRYWEANHFESRVSLFNRYIVANDGNVRLAKDMFVADIAWRDEIKILELQRLTREMVTGVQDAVFRQVRGLDRVGVDESGLLEVRWLKIKMNAWPCDDETLLHRIKPNHRPYHSTTARSCWASTTPRAATTLPSCTVA